MPIFDFRCGECSKTFELLVRSATVPACPACGSEQLEKQVAAPTAPGQSAGLVAKARAQANKEGHFSNYKRSEKPRFK
ncbi:MAG: zinc ribbon domain-containing protein [Sulfuricella sp.]|nr:zinc ribbon domain-containing protein [Sulfuricella sp.]